MKIDETLNYSINSVSLLLFGQDGSVTSSDVFKLAAATSLRGTPLKLPVTGQDWTQTHSSSPTGVECSAC